MIMAAGNFIKYMFCSSIIFFGVKTLFLIKQINENYKDIQVASINVGETESVNSFYPENSVQDNKLNMGTNEGYHHNNIFTSKGKLKENTADLKYELLKRANVTSAAASRLQKKRKLLSQLWDQYYKIQQSASKDLKDVKSASKNLKDVKSASKDLNDVKSFNQVGDDIFVFSAFYDERPTETHQNAVVRILTISKLISRTTLACKFPHTRVDKWVLATKNEMSDNHSKTYGGIMYICNIPREIGEKPPKKVYLQSVLTPDDNFSKVTSGLVRKDGTPLQMSIMKSTINSQEESMKDSSSAHWKNDAARTFLEHNPNDKELKNIHTANKSKGITVTYQGRQLDSSTMQKQEELLPANDKMPKLAMCVSPLFGDIKLSEFIQFVEIHKILGVKHIFFYKMNISTDIDTMLAYYRSQGIVTSIHWSLPRMLQNSANIWYHGQIAAQQDCLYRNIGNFDYTAFVDIDEVIVPCKTTDLPKMIKTLQTNLNDKTNSTAAVFTLRSAFFESDVKTEETNITKHQKLSFLKNIYRNDIVSLVRNKVIVKSTYTEQTGIHHVSKLLKYKEKLETIDVPMETVLIHHYRKCTTALDTEMHCGNYLTDTSLLKYSGILTENYKHALEANIPYFRSMR